MHRASWVLACGANYMLLGPKATMLKSEKPVISICAIRTGAGKSQTSRRITEILKKYGKKVAVVRHPMPYGDLTKQICQKFETLSDLDKHECTIEEREEYEPHIEMGNVVFAGVDYEVILREAEKLGDFVLWEGGNNDTSFYKPDLSIVVADPHRAGHELTYHPGETNLRMSDVIVINKVDTASYDSILKLKENIHRVNPNAVVIEAASPFFLDDYKEKKNKRVLAVEDGPTLTHGEMSYGAAVLAAKKFGAKELVDPRDYAVGSIRDTFAKYPHTGALLPAMGYGKKQIKDLEATINKTPCDIVVSATPIDLNRILKVNKPIIHVRYELQEIGSPTLEDILKEKFNL